MTTLFPSPERRGGWLLPALLSAGLLALLQYFAAPRIEQQRQAAAERALPDLLPAGMTLVGSAPAGCVVADESGRQRVTCEKPDGLDVGETAWTITLPVVVDAGIGAPSHAAEAMEMGASAVLVNTAIAVAQDPVQMAVAFKMAVETGRMAYEAQLAPQTTAASATSPLNPFLEGIKGLQQ